MKNTNTFVTDAINIKSYPLSENDNIVVMFSRDKGLIKGIAKGVKKPKSKLGARMQSLVCNKLMLNEGRNLDVIKEAQAINPFNKLRYNLDKLNYSIYITEIIGNFCKENTEETSDVIKNIYELFYKTLENISNAEDAVHIMFSVIKFQLKFMREMGFGIELSHCLKCSCSIEEESYFSIENGGVTCRHCLPEDPYGGHKIRIHKKITKFLCDLLNSDIDETTKYDELINEKVVSSCFNLLRKYIDNQTGRECKTLKVLEMTKV